VSATRRLTFVVDGPLDQPTGGYIYDRIVIEGLRELGFEVDVMSLRTRGAFTHLEAGARVMSRLSERGRIVVVDELCHPRTLLALAPRLVSRRATLVALVHHLAASERTGLAARARLALERPLLHAADRLIVTSETTRRAVVAAGAKSDDVVVVRPGRDRLGGRSTEPRGPLGGPVRFLFVGALTPRKDVLGLLEAYGRVADRATLTIAGPADRDHPYAAAVLRAASSVPGSVRITGTIGDDALAEELGRHDVLVLPSRHEGFGIVLAEALAHGLAVVATGVGAIPEVVRDGREAVLVPAGDTVALGAALERLVGRPELVAEMQRAALLAASELPTWADSRRAFAEALS